jgi:hypothetical protein
LSIQAIEESLGSFPELVGTALADDRFWALVGTFWLGRPGDTNKPIPNA